MKNRHPYLIAASLLATSFAAHATTIVPSFLDLINGAPLVNNGTGLVGYQGWSQSEASDPAYPLAYGHAIGVNQDPGLAIGGAYSVPVADSGYISSPTLNSAFAVSSVQLSFTIGRPVDAPLGDPNNRFEIGVYSSGSNLFSLGFTPNINNPNVWDLSYRVGSAVDIVDPNNSVSLSQMTFMNLSFTNASNPLLSHFNLALTTAGQTHTYNGDIPIGPTTTIDELRVSMLKVPGTNPSTDPYAAYGTNFIAIVPEPTSMMLFGLAGATSLLRRRRA